MSHLSFLFAAYSAVWLVLFLYLFFLSRHHRRLKKEVEGLRELLKKKGLF